MCHLATLPTEAVSLVPHGPHRATASSFGMNWKSSSLQSPRVIKSAATRTRALPSSSRSRNENVSSVGE